MSLTQLLVPTYRQMLRALSGWLEKSRDRETGADALLSARLAPDMFPLSSQVRFACFQAQEAVYRLRGEAIPDALIALAKEGRAGGERPGSIEDALSRIDEALAFLDGLGPDALDDGAGRAIVLDLPDGTVFDMNGEQYARDWALAQFHFHLVTAYGILRSRGVALGKADYVRHMFAYVRPGAMPEG